MSKNKKTIKTNVNKSYNNKEIVEIDVDNLSEHSIVILSAYLAQRPDLMVLAPFPKDPSGQQLSYELDDGLRFIVNKPLICYRCESKKNTSSSSIFSRDIYEWRFLPVGNEFAKGGTSVIKLPADVENIIGFKNNKYWLKPKENKPSQDRLLKEIQAKDKEKILDEYKFMKRVEYLHAKHAAIHKPLGSPKYVGYIIMRKLPGQELKSFFSGEKKPAIKPEEQLNNHDLNGIQEFNTEPVLQELSIHQKVKHLRALASSIDLLHRKYGIVHRDLKPDNIMTHTTASGEVEFYPFDFGLAKDISTDDSNEEPRGTYDYMSYETFYKEGTHPATDVLAFARMAGTYFGAKQPPAVRRMEFNAKFDAFHKKNQAKIAKGEAELKKPGLLDEDRKRIRLWLNKYKSGEYQHFQVEKINANISLQFIKDYKFYGLDFAGVPEPYQQPLENMLKSSQHTDYRLRPSMNDFIRLLDKIDLAFEARTLMQLTDNILMESIDKVINFQQNSNFPNEQFKFTLEQLRIHMVEHFSCLKNDKHAQLKDFKKLHAIAKNTHNLVIQITNADADIKSLKNAVDIYHTSCRHDNPVNSIKKLLFKICYLTNKFLCCKIAAEHNPAPSEMQGPSVLQDSSAENLLGFFGKKFAYKYKLETLANHLIIHSSTMFTSGLHSKKSDVETDNSDNLSKADVDNTIVKIKV